MNPSTLLTEDDLERGPTQCRYPGSCTQERAIKLNGSLHRFCEFHRQSQNECQRNSQRRKRLRQQEMAPQVLHNMRSQESTMDDLEWLLSDLDDASSVEMAAQLSYVDIAKTIEALDTNDSSVL